MDVQFVRDRITQLRIKAGVSEREMSLALGHSSSYINGISSGRITPSLKELFYICEYLNVTPSEFFRVKDEETKIFEHLLEEYTRISGEISALVSDLNATFERYRNMMP